MQIEFLLSLSSAPPRFHFYSLTSIHSGLVTFILLVHVLIRYDSVRTCSSPRSPSSYHIDRTHLHYEYYPRHRSIRIFLLHDYPLCPHHCFHCNTHNSPALFDSGSEDIIIACSGANIIIPPWPRYTETKRHLRIEASMARKIRDEHHSRLERAAWHNRRFVCKRHRQAQATRLLRDKACPDLRLPRWIATRLPTLDLLLSTRLSGISIL